MHFSRLAAYEDADVPIIARGEGCYVLDEHGKRYLDGLSGLFTVQVGHGRAELAEAAARPGRDSSRYFPIWSYAHPAADRARGAPRRAGARPTSTGCSSPPAAPRRWSRRGSWPASTSALIGQPQRHKVIARDTAYHGTTLGALAITGIPALRDAVRATDARRRARRQHQPLPPSARPTTRRRSCRDRAEAIEDAIEFEGPDTVAAVFLEPVQNAGGCFPPPEGYFARVREICDRHGVLLVSDEVICAFGRLGHMFGCERYDYLPDIITWPRASPAATRRSAR